VLEIALNNGNVRNINHVFLIILYSNR